MFRFSNLQVSHDNATDHEKSPFFVDVDDDDDDLRLDILTQASQDDNGGQ